MILSGSFIRLLGFIIWRYLNENTALLGKKYAVHPIFFNEILC